MGGPKKWQRAKKQQARCRKPGVRNTLYSDRDVPISAQKLIEFIIHSLKEEIIYYLKEGEEGRYSWEEV